MGKSSEGRTPRWAHASRLRGDVMSRSPLKFRMVTLREGSDMMGEACEGVRWEGDAAGGPRKAQTDTSRECAGKELQQTRVGLIPMRAAVIAFLALGTAVAIAWWITRPRKNTGAPKPPPGPRAPGTPSSGTRSPLVPPVPSGGAFSCEYVGY